jgi:FkbM family methyltransferase
MISPPDLILDADPPVTAEFVNEAYRVLLGRDPESEDVVQGSVRKKVRRSELVASILRSLEFSTSPSSRALYEHWDPDYQRRAATCDSVCAHFARSDVKGEEGFYKDFLGVRTRVTYVPEMLPKNGMVFGLPGQGQGIGFDPGEWEGTLRSILEARDRVVGIELGAGWAPWLVSIAAASRIREIADIHLVGVEADPGHFEMMLTHFADNGIDPAEHTLFNGVVGIEDGFALFPKLPDSHQDWGAQAVLDTGKLGASFKDYRGRQFEQVDRVPCVALTTLLKRFDRVDIIHCDIQGGEVEVIPAAFDEINRRVRRIVIGTHSREAEGVALGHFAQAGWALELETPVKFYATDGRVVPYEDGLQVWSNPRLG